MENLTTVSLDKTSTVLKLLGDKTRLKIMALLHNRECCVCELVEILHMSQPAISQHLRKLKDGKLIVEHRKGQWVFYEWNTNSEHFSLLESILEYIPNVKHELEELDNKGLRIICR
ncbi:metalloregulator ArsR/SmtB family transcription factor [Radiobacillus kanasensis]|uniref:ArsR/SmtB family transcription factor n=1 Tax=Radiobacillus kanasensis TaxID=2844358 RepID=UPI001E594272|nr:metalloregulator ArsR/SmtB family transcription factor [Radiobacillus kanasensis]UFT99787.1 metalloregulator ArsR/SmtB family transcription factor [Radiobacillus kanasensis]